jgi:hypothetical protein
LVIIRGTVEQIIDVNLNPLLAKAGIISTELIPIITMGEGEVLIIKHLSKFSYTEARQEVQDIPESAFREIPLHSSDQRRVPAASQASFDKWAP